MLFWCWTLAGESLIGMIVGIRQAVGICGENHQILVKDEAGNIIAAWLTQWLKENIKAQSLMRRCGCG